MVTRCLLSLGGSLATGRRSLDPTLAPLYLLPRSLRERGGVLVMALEENVLDARKEAYLEWLTTPPGERQPESKAKYAVHVGVAEQTLRRWEKEKLFREEWRRRSDEVVGSPERQQKLLDRLFEQGMQGDVKAADLFLRVTGKLVPPPVTIKDERKVEQLSDAELAALATQLASAEQDRRRKAS